ncbi:MAG: TldD/PmbA family protein [Desulfurococcales archaeon]|nr:TldD/PmbA family protein [Desulfurococcales archaeon]
MGSIRELINLDKVVRKAEELGASEVEVILIDVKSTEVVGVKNRVDRVMHSMVARVGFRVAVGKRVACYGSEVSDANDVLKSLESAVKIAKVMGEDRDWSGLPPKLGSGGEALIYDDALVKIGVSDLVDMVYDGLKVLKCEKPAVEPAILEIMTRNARYLIANSYGGIVESSGTLAELFVEAKSRDSGREATYSEFTTSRSLSGLRFDDVVRRVRERVIDALRAEPIETRKIDVVFEPKVIAAILMSALLPAIAADNVQEGRSPLKGRVGQQVFSEDVRLTDDPFMPWRIGSKPFDDEGVATRVKDVVDKGVLKTFLYDHYTARKEGRESTGNASRSSPASRPRPWATNLVLAEGSEGLDEILSDCRECLVISSTIGQWLSNPVSGQVNATVTHGYLVRSGEVVGVVKGVGITGNIYDMLGKNLEVIGKGIDCYINACCPPVKVREVTVAGK